MKSREQELESVEAELIRPPSCSTSLSCFLSLGRKTVLGDTVIAKTKEMEH